VLIRTRNPCVFLRCRVFGWNVRLPFTCDPFGKNEPSILANAFRECQSRRLCVRVGVLHRLGHLQRRGPKNMRIWSLPKVFHTCGKNCGNSRGITSALANNPIFRGLTTGRRAAGRIKTPPVTTSSPAHKENGRAR
jgi:hypothetical protein